MIFREGTALYEYEIIREAGQDIMYINYLGATSVPSLADSPICMARTIDNLIESPNASRIIFVQQRNYSYDFPQVSMLLEIAQLYTYLIKQERILSFEKLAPFTCKKCLGQRYNAINYLILTILKQDPIGCYIETKRLLREERINAEKLPESCSKCETVYMNLLEKIIELLDKTTLIAQAKPMLNAFHLGDRSIYSTIFRGDIIPNFTFTRLVASLPHDAEIIDQYEVEAGYDKSTVTILKMPNQTKYIYHITPPEYTLTEDYYTLLNLARNVLIEHRPKAEEFTDPERTRHVFFNVARDLLQELAENKRIKLGYRHLNRLATILVRHTIGFGLVEVLLQDDNLQDVVINSPIGQTNIFVRHQTYDECITNIVPSVEDANSWAAKFRMLSGRPLDEANPILDTDLVLEKIRARVAIIQQPLSPDGLAYALRRHREEPWTLPLFIKNRALNPISAGLLSFLVDGARTILVAGTRGAGKTSLLGSLMLEIMPKYRVIVLEDSVTGDCKIIVKDNGIFKKTTIGELIDERIKKNGFLEIDGREKSNNLEGIQIFCIDKEGRVILSKPSKFIRHKVNKEIYEITTTSGKKIRVTTDHSLFTLDEKNIIKPIKSKDIKEGDFLAIPSKLPFDNSLESINLLNHLNKLNKRIFVLGEGIEKYILNNRKKLLKLAYSLGYKKSTIQNWIKKKILPAEIFEKVSEDLDKEELLIKSYGCSGKIPANLILDEEFLSFAGLWLADGCYDKNSVIISVQEGGNREIVRKIASRLGIAVKMHSDKFSSMLNLTLLREIMEKILELKGNAYTKKIPSWAYNLSDKQAGWLLRGFFSGDGCVSDKEIVFSICSEELIDDITNLLLRFNIVLRTSDRMRKDKTFNCRIGSTKMINRFNESIGFLVQYKQVRLGKLCSRVSTHDTSDVIPLSLDVKTELNEILGKKFNKHDYITRQNNLGREHLSKLLEMVPNRITNPIEPLKAVVQSNIFWDKVKEIKKIDYEGYVYDISVPEIENFICENFVAHNTLELPVDALRKLGYDILRMKVRAALLKETTEVPADEGIRTSLRLGDSCLIVGEVRSLEARALYEAMRVGALANVVAGTIHGASPYGVFDRVVNDLQVPITSFKATDIIAIINPIKSPDGLHSWRRMVSLTEVRKHWTKDPLEEKGFVDLLGYNVNNDELEVTPDLKSGESEILKAIAANVKGWAGNWDAVWDNIMLRAMIKNEIVNVAEKTGMPELLEASFNAKSNNAFHQISDKVSKDIGLPEGKQVFREWKDWLKQEIKKKQA